MVAERPRCVATRWQIRTDRSTGDVNWASRRPAHESIISQWVEDRRSGLGMVLALIFLSDGRPDPPTTTWMASSFQLPRIRAPRSLVALGVAAIICLLIWSYDIRVPRPSLFPAKEDPTDVAILLVSAFFPLAKSKHSTEDYAGWLKKYLTKVTTHIYFFAPPEIESMIRELRGDLPMTLNTSFSSPFDIPPLRDLRGRYEEMHELDLEKDIHSPELYAVWSSKTYFLGEGLRNSKANGFDFTWAFWNDAGSFRDDQEFTAWPNRHRISDIFLEGSRLTGTRAKDLFFMPIWDSPGDNLKGWQEDDGPIQSRNSVSEGRSISSSPRNLTRSDLSAYVGSFFGGHGDAIAWWGKAYFA